MPKPTQFDNFSINVVGEGVDMLKKILSVYEGVAAYGYVKSKDNDKLVICGSPAHEVIEFVSVVSASDLAETLHQWLMTTAKYPHQPDIDGDCHKGFRLFNNNWGSVEGFRNCGIFAIAPEWTLYGK